MKSIRIFTALALMMLITTVADAQTVRSRVPHRRIAQGVRSGELTRTETRHLAREQRDIRRDKREARADGKLTRRERKEIKRETRRANRHIYRKKHNRRDRI